MKPTFIDTYVEPERWEEAYWGDLREMYKRDKETTQIIRNFKSRFYKILFNAREAIC